MERTSDDSPEMLPGSAINCWNGDGVLRLKAVSPGITEGMNLRSVGAAWLALLAACDVSRLQDEILARSM